MGSPFSSKVLCISAVTLCGTYSYFCGQCVEFSKYRGGVNVVQRRLGKKWTYFRKNIVQSLQYIRTRVRIGLIVYLGHICRTNIMWVAISNLLKNFAIHSLYLFDPFIFSLKSIHEMNDRIEASIWNRTEMKRGKLQYILCFFRKGGWISESFLTGSNFPKWMPNPMSMVIWHPFLEILEI